MAGREELFERDRGSEPALDGIRASWCRRLNFHRAWNSFDPNADTAELGKIRASPC